MLHTYAHSSNNKIAAVLSTEGYFPKASSTGIKTNNIISIGDDTYSDKDMLHWGTDNLWPQNTYKLIRKDDILPALIKWKTDVIYGGGLVYGIEFMQNDKRVFKELMIDEIDAWLEETDIDLYLNEAPRDFYSYGNFYPKLIPSVNAKNIAYLYAQDAQTCRMGKQGNNGHIHQVLTHGDWENASLASKTYPAVDRYGNVQKQIAAMGQKHFMLPMFLRINGNVAYETPTWYGIVEGGWLELSQQIPIFKKTKMANSAVLRLHIQINEKYFTDRYPGWNSDKKKYTPEKVQEILSTEATALLDSISGHDKAGKLLMSGFKITPDGRTEEMIKITRLDNEKEGGDYIEDSQESDYKKIRAFNVPPVLYGSTPGAKNLAGSGSEGRVAMNHYIMTNFADQKRVLYPLQVIATRNNWHNLAKLAAGLKPTDSARLVFKTKNYHIAKLEEGKEIKTADNGTDNQ